MNKCMLRILVVHALVLVLAGTATAQGDASAIPGPAGKMPMMKMMGESPAGGHPCGMAGPAPCGHGVVPMQSLAARLEMMLCFLSGRMPMNPAAMQTMMDRIFYLDRSDELGLDAGQVARLKEIRNACRADNIRSGADLKVVRLELEEALQGEWRLKGVEPLLLKIHRIENEIQVRHLRALEEARSVLTAEQRMRAAQP